MPTSVPLGLPEMNASTRDVVVTLLRYGPMARAELARRLTLSPAALTKLSRPMIEIGLFQETMQSTRRGSGRPSHPLSIDPGWASFVGIKLTGDHAHGVLTDLAGSILATVEVPLDGSEPDDVGVTIVQMVNILAHGSAGRKPPAVVGVSLAGSVVRSRGCVVASPFLGWRNVDLAPRLERLLGVPVVVENDLRALTTAQHWFDVSLTSFALVTFGAGVGCGLVLDDRLIEGSGGAAGLIDHLRIGDRGPLCARGHRGCASGYATTGSILHAVAGQSDHPVADLAEVGIRARGGDPVAQRVLRDAGYAIGCVIGTVCNVTGPAAVILSGEGAELFDTLSDSLEAGMADTIHPALPPIPLTVRPMEFAEWARGAAVVAIQRHLQLPTASTA